MTTESIFPSLIRYQAWAHDAFLEALANIDGETHTESRHAAIRVLNHCYVVNLIFKAHMTGGQHGFAANNTPDTPSPQELRAAIADLDSWLLNYAQALTPEQLAQSISFVFTDGDTGCMTRQEMLLQIVTHGTFHRGEVGRLFKQMQIEPPWDTFAVWLHQADPSRRLPG